MQKSGWLLWRSWRSGQTRKSINQLKETLQKEDILYCHEFELAKLERHNARSQGRRPEENRAALKEELPG